MMNVCNPCTFIKKTHANPKSLLSSLREHGDTPIVLNQLWD
jgi:hypothetical protein